MWIYYRHSQYLKATLLQLGHDWTVTDATRPGRRPGRPRTREQILAAAGRLFADLGYDRTTVRGIAEAAGVDSRLVTHYFGSKQRLFLETTELPADPRVMFPVALRSGTDPARGLAEFIAGSLVDEQFQRVSSGLVRAAASDPEASVMAREFLTERMLRPIAEQIGADQPELRASLLASLTAGLVLARNILRIEPLASLEPAELAAWLTPVVRRYLLDPLPPAVPDTAPVPKPG